MSPSRGPRAAGPPSLPEPPEPGPWLWHLPPPLPELVRLSERMKLIFPPHVAAGSPIVTAAPRRLEGEGEGVQQEGVRWEPHAALAHLLPLPVPRGPSAGIRASQTCRADCPAGVTHLSALSAARLLQAPT